MSATTSSTSSIESEYRARTKGSAKLYAEACKVIPAGLTHDSRSTLPIRSTRRARSSATHGPAEVARTLDAFRPAVRWLKAEGDIKNR